MFDDPGATPFSSSQPATGAAGAAAVAGPGLAESLAGRADLSSSGLGATTQAGTTQAGAPQAGTTQASTTQASTTGGGDSGAAADKADTVATALAGMAPGAGLAEVIEGLVSRLLSPAAPASTGTEAGTQDAAGPPCPEASSTSATAPATNQAAAREGSEHEEASASQEGSTSAGLLDGAPGLADLLGPGEQQLVAAAGAWSLEPAARLEVQELAGLGAQVLGEVIAACGRLASWAQWAQALASAALARTDEMWGGAGTWGPDGRPQAGTAEAARFTTCGEVACRLGMSRTQASRLVERGQALLEEPMAATESMHRVGLLDAARTDVVTGRLAGLEEDVVRVVQARVLPRASRRTPAQLGRDLDRALELLDPQGSQARRRRAAARRHVTRPRPAGEGVSAMRVVLPSLDAFLLDATLDAIAASALASGDTRCASQLRADALVAMSLSTLRDSQGRACEQAESGSGQAADPTSLVVPATQDAQEAAWKAAWPGSVTDHDTSLGASRRVSRAAGARVASTTGDPATVPGRAGRGGAAGNATDGARSSSASPPGPPAAVPGVPGSVLEGVWGPGLLPDGVPLEGLLAGLSSLVDPATTPWWTPSGTPPLPLPGGLSVNVDVTVPLDHLTRLLDADDTAPPDTDPPGRQAPPPGRETTRQTPPPGRETTRQTPSPGRETTRRTPPPGRETTRRTPPPGRETAKGTGPLSRKAPGASSPVTGSSTPPGNPPRPVPTTSVAQVRVGRRGSPVVVPTSTALALAAGGTWRRLVTDPLSGVVLDVGRTRYRPPAGLADLARARDASCTHPGCDTPARSCDLDHIVSWSQGGRTTLDNLAILCQAHHRLKHTPGWTLSRTAEGHLTWTTPSGARYHRHLDGTITMAPRHTGPRSLLHPGGRVPDHLAQAVTPDVLDRLHRGLSQAQRTRQTQPVLSTQGPAPGHSAGEYETTPYPQALHTLGLAPLLDTVPPF